MFGAKQSANELSRSYATAADFCRIFENNMNRLYLLSYLLTGDREMAEECFVRGLEDSTGHNRVFREWADSWARRTIVHNAIQMIHPRPSDKVAAQPRSQATSSEPASTSAVLGLPAFERFVFVMSVLERQSIQECSVLLGCHRKDVTAARVRALQLMGQGAQPSDGKDRIRESASRASRGSSLPLTAAAHLVVSA